MSDVLVRSEPLGGSPLSKAARAGELPQWFLAPPRSPDQWRAYAKSVISSVSSAWVDALAPAMAARGAAAERLAKSAGGKGLVVTTGQQPGLFGGPLMTLAKALSARALADVLQETTGVPVAPIFWAATDDADFDEACGVSVALDGGARDLTLEQRAPAGTPMARAPMGGEVAELARLMRDACGSAPHAEHLEAVLAAYREGATVGDAYVASLRHVLEPLGVVVLDASHPCVAEAAAPIMARAAQRADALADALTARDAAIAAAGYEPQVEAVKGLSLVFVNERGTKRRLTQAEARTFAPSDERWLSSTVLLRPALERALLPTTAYVGGPGEVAYFAQVSAVSEVLELPRPLVVPRWSTTIVEPRIQRILDDLDLSVEALSAPDAVETRLARARVPRDVDARVADLRNTVNAHLAALGGVSRDVVAAEVIEGVRRNIAHRIDRLERRIVAGVKRNETTLMRELATVRGALYPHGARQERKLGWLPFVARYGPDLLSDMLIQAGAHARSLVGAPVAAGTRDSALTH